MGSQSSISAPWGRPLDALACMTEYARAMPHLEGQPAQQHREQDEPAWPAAGVVVVVVAVVVVWRRRKARKAGRKRGVKRVRA